MKSYHVALMQPTTGTPYAEPRSTFNDLPINEQFKRHERYAQAADDYRQSSTKPKAPIFLLAPEYLYSAHRRNTDGDVTHRFLANRTKKRVLAFMRQLSSKLPMVVFIFSMTWRKRQKPGHNKVEGRNTTYVYRGGEKLFSQHKRGDAGELLSGDILAGIRYRRPGDPVSSLKRQRQPVDGLFFVDNSAFGIETCCDFGCRLPDSLTNAKNREHSASTLDGQFLISSTLDHTQAAEDSHKLGEKIFHSKYFFHANGRRDLWAPNTFSKHLSGGHKVTFHKDLNNNCLEPLHEKRVMNNALPCYSVTTPSARKRKRAEKPENPQKTTHPLKRAFRSVRRFCSRVATALFGNES